MNHYKFIDLVLNPIINSNIFVFYKHQDSRACLLFLELLDN